MTTPKRRTLEEIADAIMDEMGASWVATDPTIRPRVLAALREVADAAEEFYRNSLVRLAKSVDIDEPLQLIALAENNDETYIDLLIKAIGRRIDAARQEEREALRHWLGDVGEWASRGTVLAWLDARSRGEEPKSPEKS